jgi:hypothetical protein
MANTGNRIFSRLLKVIDDGTNRPLDENNILCSISGLPEVRKDNIFGQADYIAPTQDLSLCPLPTPPSSDRQDIFLYNYNQPGVFNVIGNVLIDGVDIFVDTDVFPVSGGQSKVGFINNVNPTAVIIVQTSNAADTPIRVSAGGVTQCQISNGYTQFTVNLSTGNTISIEMDVAGGTCS